MEKKKKTLPNMLQVGKPEQHSAGGQGLLAALQDHLPSRRAEMLIRAINSTPAPDAPPKRLAEDTTFLQASKELEQHCLSKAEQPRDANALSLVAGGLDDTHRAIRTRAISPTALKLHP